MPVDPITRPRVVVCGSMASYEYMRQVADQLAAAGLEPVVPAADGPLEQWSLEASNARKCAASRRHMDAIRDAATHAVLVVNVDRGGCRDYIGPNSFAEVAVAFAEQRAVFLLQGLPDAYADELLAWGVQPLHGDLRPLLAATGPCVGIAQDGPSSGERVPA